jgi:hypothetical protein
VGYGGDNMFTEIHYATMWFPIACMILMIPCFGILIDNQIEEIIYYEQQAQNTET